MARMWKVISFLLVSILLLSACGKTVEEQVKEGLSKAEEAFYQEPKTQNEEVDGAKFYRPSSFKVSDTSDAQNIVLNKGKQPFILFMNPNEEKDSRLFYDLLQVDDEDLLGEEKFSDGDVFGFVAIVENDNEVVELIVNVGGAKITTLTEKKHIVSDLETMMQIVQSID